MKALKEAAGNTNGKNEVTFEEFTKGVFDFPFLLEQFKQEYESFVSPLGSIGSQLESPLGELIEEMMIMEAYERDENRSPNDEHVR